MWVDVEIVIFSTLSLRFSMVYGVLCVGNENRVKGKPLYHFHFTCLFVSINSFLCHKLLMFTLNFPVEKSDKRTLTPVCVLCVLSVLSRFRMTNVRCL